MRGFLGQPGGGGGSSFSLLGLINAFAGWLTAAPDLDLNLQAGTDNTGSGGNDININATDAKAASTAPGGNVNAYVGAPDSTGAKGYFKIYSTAKPDMFKFGEYPSAGYPTIWGDIPTPGLDNWSLRIISTTYIELKSDHVDLCSGSNYANASMRNGFMNFAVPIVASAGPDAAGDTPDVGLSRIAAGVWGVTNGSTGGGRFSFPNISTPSAIPGSSLIYAKDVAGTSKLFCMNGAGAEVLLSL